MDSTEITEEPQAKFRKVNLNMEFAMMEQIQQSGDKFTDFIQKACAARLVALGLRQPDIQSGPYHADPRIDAMAGQVAILVEALAKLQTAVQKLQDEAEEQAAKIVMLQTDSAGNADQGDIGDEGE